MNPLRSLPGACALFAALLLPTSRAEQTTPVVVASYNVENWLLTDRRNEDGSRVIAPKPEEEKVAVTKVIAGIRPDILGLIEIGSQNDFSDLQTRLVSEGLDYPHSEWLQAAEPDRRLALLSRFPIVARNSRTDIRFDLGGKLRPMARGILDVTLQINPDYQLRLIGVHLKSKRKVPEYD